jgi:hypothetical protein
MWKLQRQVAKLVIYMAAKQWQAGSNDQSSDLIGFDLNLV